MRIPAVLVLAAALAGCGAAERDTANAASPAVLMGEFRAASELAQRVTGDASIERGGLIFGKGVVLYTRVLEPRRGTDTIARDGDSYAAIALGPSTLRVELRRIVEQSVADGSAGLCGDADPSYVALAHDERATSVTVMVFAGDEPPGPNATSSQLCGAFGFVAPDGARTRQGVLLQ
jgi:hypothetical protein